MSTKTVAAALKTWLSVHPLARQVFRNVHYLERHLRHRREDAMPLETLELALDELRSAGFHETEVLDALEELQTRLWRLDQVDAVVVRELAGPRGSLVGSTVLQVRTLPQASPKSERRLKAVCTGDAQ